MSGRRLSLKEMNMVRHEQEIWNAMIKRGEIDPTKFVREQWVVCGCGAEGCGFVTTWMKNHPAYPNVVDLEDQKRVYQEWLEFHANK